MSNKPRFQVVETPSGHHGRYVSGGNSKKVWWTQVYKGDDGKRSAEHAIDLLKHDLGYTDEGFPRSAASLHETKGEVMETEFVTEDTDPDINQEEQD